MLELTVAVHRWRFTSSIPPAHKEGWGGLLPLPYLYCNSLEASHSPAMTRRLSHETSDFVVLCIQDIG